MKRPGLLCMIWPLFFGLALHANETAQKDLLPAIDVEAKSLVNILTLGRLTESEADQALAEALKNPPERRDRFGHKTWQIFKSPSKDRINFHWINQEGPRENFVQLFSFWMIRSDSNDETPKFNLSAFAADQCELYLNGKKIAETETKDWDYRKLYRFENLSLDKIWNHVLFRIDSKHFRTEKPGTLGVRIQSNDKKFLENLKTAVQRGGDEKARIRGVHPNAKKVDTSTLHGKLMSGYQGWFRAAGDGSGRGFGHYNGKEGKFEPGVCSIDLWPDLDEMDDDEKFPTAFKHADGRTAFVFSSRVEKTVVRHFSWMERYGLDGVFLQRFAGGVKNEQNREDLRAVMENVRNGAERHGRTWAMMYDLSGVGENLLVPLVTEDWKRLVDEDQICKDEMYLRHNGKPVVAVWGIGFSDKRSYTLKECLELIAFLKDDPQYGGNTVMLGVPTYWRELHRDALNDPLLHEIIKKADIVSPWTVGRYGTVEQAKKHIVTTAGADRIWCKENGKDYFPVVFPGFSWFNLMKNRGQEAKLNSIPRLKGEFLTEQIKAHLDDGATMIYQAMFDEIDEATAIFKCSNDPPVGESPFITYEELPSDFYLKLLGQASKALKRKAGKSELLPDKP